MTDHVGQHLGNYQLIQLLGQGYWASVYHRINPVLKERPCRCKMDTCGAVWPFEVFGRMEAGTNLHQERDESMSSIYTSDNFVIYTANNGNPSTEYYAPPPRTTEDLYCLDV
jgi:hypothetical protein